MLLKYNYHFDLIDDRYIFTYYDSIYGIFLFAVVFVAFFGGILILPLAYLILKSKSFNVPRIRRRALKYSVIEILVVVII